MDPIDPITLEWNPIDPGMEPYGSYSPGMKLYGSYIPHNPVMEPHRPYRTHNPGAHSFPWHILELSLPRAWWWCSRCPVPVRWHIPECSARVPGARSPAHSGTFPPQGSVPGARFPGTFRNLPSLRAWWWCPFPGTFWNVLPVFPVPIPWHIPEPSIPFRPRWWWSACGRCPFPGTFRNVLPVYPVPGARSPAHSGMFSPQASVVVERVCPVPGARSPAHSGTFPPQASVVVERVWPVPLGRAGAVPRLQPRRHRVFRLLRDGKHRPRGDMELLLSRAVQDLGGRGDVVSVRKSLGRNKLLAQGLAVYPSPENLRHFQQEKELAQQGKLDEPQTLSGQKVSWDSPIPKTPKSRELPPIPAPIPAFPDPGIPAALPARGGDEEQPELGAQPRHRGPALPQEPGGVCAPPRSAPAPGADHALGQLLVRRHGERAGHGAGAHGRGAVPAPQNQTLPALAAAAAAAAGEQPGAPPLTPPEGFGGPPRGIWGFPRGIWGPLEGFGVPRMDLGCPGRIWGPLEGFLTVPPSLGSPQLCGTPGHLCIPRAEFWGSLQPPQISLNPTLVQGGPRDGFGVPRRDLGSPGRI
uniref:Large ribosomal subunit protein bL9m n=1 Tax=Taeniopygia guttata TaxID=59729 RepID=A0A674GIF0_TAEGU